MATGPMFGKDLREEPRDDRWWERLAAVVEEHGIRIGEEEKAVARRLYDGRVVAVGAGIGEAAAILAVLAAALDAPVHVFCRDEKRSRQLLSRWRGLLAAAEVTAGALRAKNRVAERRRTYQARVVIGGHHQFRADYLRDHLARVPGEAVDPQRGRAVVVDAETVLVRAGTDLGVLWEDSGVVAARIPVTELLELYAVVGVLSRQRLPKAVKRVFGETVMGSGAAEPAPDTAAVSHDVALELSSVEKSQRQWVYALRDYVLHGGELRDVVQAQFAAALEDIVGAGETIDDIWRATRKLCGAQAVPTRSALRSLSDRQAMVQLLRHHVEDAYQRRRSQVGDTIAAFERKVLLTVIDIAWTSHLSRLEAACPHLTASHVPTADDVAAYRRQATESESLLRAAIARDATGYLFHAQLGQGVVGGSR